MSAGGKKNPPPRRNRNLGQGAGFSLSPKSVNQNRLSGGLADGALVDVSNLFHGFRFLWEYGELSATSIVTELTIKIIPLSTDGMVPGTSDSGTQFVLSNLPTQVNWITQKGKSTSAGHIVEVRLDLVKAAQKLRQIHLGSSVELLQGLPRDALESEPCLEFLADGLSLFNIRDYVPGAYAVDYVVTYQEVTKLDESTRLMFERITRAYSSIHGVPIMGAPTVGVPPRMNPGDAVAISAQAMQSMMTAMLAEFVRESGGASDSVGSGTVAKAKGAAIRAVLGASGKAKAEPIQPLKLRPGTGGASRSASVSSARVDLVTNIPLRLALDKVIARRGKVGEPLPVPGSFSKYAENFSAALCNHGEIASFVQNLLHYGCVTSEEWEQTKEAVTVLGLALLTPTYKPTFAPETVLSDFKTLQLIVYDRQDQIGSDYPKVLQEVVEAFEALSRADAKSFGVDKRGVPDYEDDEEPQ